VVVASARAMGDWWRSRREKNTVSGAPLVDKASSIAVADGSEEGLWLFARRRAT